jgi:Tfp pilus assembly protein PilF
VALHTDLTIALARLYRRAGMPAKAEAVLKTRLKTDPKAFDARMDLAMLYSAQKRDAAAIAEYSSSAGAECSWKRAVLAAANGLPGA